MGRPIKKSFFANLNSPYQDQATGGTTGYGGEGVASYGTIVAGSGWTAAPTVTVSPPDFAFDGAATATVQVHYQALSFATTANGSGYDVGDVLEVHTGTAGTKARAPVATIIVVGTPTKNNGGSGYADGDLLTFSGAGWSTPLVLRVNRPGGGTGTPDNFTVTQAGIRTAAAPTNPVAYTSRTGSGNGCTVDITWGVYSFGAVTVPGDYTAFPSTSGQLDSVTPATGTGATATITLGLLSATVLTPGRGYTSPADALLGFSGSTGASATAVLTQAYDNGLKVYAFVDGGGSGVLGDILKQESSHRYLVKTAQGQSQCKLVAKATGDLLVGEMNLIATDSLNSTYFVTKLTSHRANLTQYTDGGSGFEYGATDVAGWTINSATTGTVSISNV